MSELREDADRGALMHGEYAGACDACGATYFETKDFNGIIMCPLCRAGVREETVIANKIIEEVKSTPDIGKEYMCHGDPHFSNSPDYEEMQKRIIDILRGTRFDNQ